MKLFIDTSVIVASVVARHPHYPRARSVIRGVLGGSDRGCVAAHGLAEAYAVLTRLPVSPRIGPESANKLIQTNLVANFDIIALTGREYARLLPALAERGVMGGAVYDGIALACARKCRADRIYTFNVKDFCRVDPELADRVTAP